MQISPFAGVPALPAFQDDQGHRPLEAFGQGLPATQNSGPVPLPARSASLGSQPCSVADLLSTISLLAPPALGSGGQHTLVNWVQPSGPRSKGQGVEDVEQGVVLAEPTPTGGALLRVTLLAAGFIIGPSGSCVREVCQQTGTDIKSWTADPDERCRRSCRVFRVEGPRAGVVRAVGILCDAVQRYKDLCEGQYAGQTVARVQRVGGIDFHYQPPPRSVVPYAAALKGQAGGRRQSRGDASSRSSPGSAAGGGKPPAGRRSASQGRKAAPGLGRAASLGPASPPANAHTPSSAATRSNSLPRQVSLAGGLAGELSSADGTAVPAPEDSPKGAIAAAADRSTGSTGSSPGVAPGRGGDSGRLDGGCPTRLVRAVSLPEGSQQPLPAPADDKLEKGDVMRSLFGNQGTVDAAPASACPLPPPGATPMSLLLQQWALLDAREQADAAAALADQQGLRGGFDASEASAPHPDSRSPLGGPWPLLPGPTPSPEAELAGQGLACDGDVLVAAAAAWQGSDLAHVAAAGLDARHAAAHEHLAQLVAAGLLPAPSGAGTPLASDVAARRSMEEPAGGSRPTGAGQEGQELHMPLSAFQRTAFTPFGAVGSLPGSSPCSSTSPSTPAEHAGGSAEQSSSIWRGSSNWPASSCSLALDNIDSPSGASRQLLFQRTEPGTPRQPSAAAGAWVTPLAGPQNAQPAGAEGMLASPFAAQQAAPGAHPPFTAMPRPFAAAPGGALHARLASERAGAAEGGCPSSFVPTLPIYEPPLVSAASSPGARGRSSQLEHLNDLLALARSNSSASSPSPPPTASAAARSTGCTGAAGSTAASTLPPRPRPLPHAGGSLFASAFSPRRAALPQAPSLPLTGREPAGQLGTRSASIDSAAAGGAQDLFQDVDLMIRCMFVRE